MTSSNFLLTATFLLTFNFASPCLAQQIKLVPLSCYFNGTNHLYQTASNSYSGLESAGYEFDGNAGYVYDTQVLGTLPLYRYSNNTDHLYQLDTKKYGEPEAFGYHSDGICCYVFSSPADGRIPLNRYFNGTDHKFLLLLTVMKRNPPKLPAYHDEGIEGYVAKSDKEVAYTPRVTTPQPKTQPTKPQEAESEFGNWFDV